MVLLSLLMLACLTSQLTSFYFFSSALLYSAGIDHDMFDWGGDSSGGTGMSKKQLKLAVQKETFTDFDSSKRLRKGGKVGTSSFKSKSKFKRRK